MAQNYDTKVVSNTHSSNGWRHDDVKTSVDNYNSSAYSTWDPGIVALSHDNMTSHFSAGDVVSDSQTADSAAEAWNVIMHLNSSSSYNNISSVTADFYPSTSPHPLMTSHAPSATTLWHLSQNNWQVLPLFLIVIAGIMGNVLVCMAVATEKSLQNVTNCFLTSLAVADLFVCCVVMPLSIMTEFMGKFSDATICRQ